MVGSVFYRSGSKRVAAGWCVKFKDAEGSWRSHRALLWTGQHWWKPVSTEEEAWECLRRVQMLVEMGVEPFPPRRPRGEGGICQRSNGLWCVSVSAGHDAEGKRNRLTAYSTTEDGALDKLDQLRSKAKRLRERKADGAGEIYVIRLAKDIPNRVKVGFSVHLDSRIKSYRTGNPTLEVLGHWPGTRLDESLVLRKLRGSCVQQIGPEVFDVRAAADVCQLCVEVLQRSRVAPEEVLQEALGAPSERPRFPACMLEGLGLGGAA